MSIKKTIITTILALALVAVVAPGAAQALTTNDLMIQIAQLQAQLGTLQGQAQSGSTTGILPANCVGIDFTRDLSRNSVGSDVKCLQSILNQLNVNVANAGAGSPGNETTFFGDATRAAVARFQTMFSLYPAAGYVGPLTRAKLNSLLMTWRAAPPVGIYPAGCTSNTGYSSTTGLSCAAAPAGTYPAGCTSNAGYSSTTGLSCAAGTLPAGCTSTAGFSPLTGANCSTGVVTTTLPAGCTSTSGYSPLSGVSCSTGVTPGTATEGFITISSLTASPASNSNVTTTANVPVLGVNIKAVNSNETVGSVKLQLAVAKTLTPLVAEHPATLIQKLYVYDGTTLLASYPVTTDSVIKTGTAGTDYYMILTGTNFVIPAGQTKALTISADFNSGLESDRNLTVNLYGIDAVRGTDTLGINSTAGLATTRVYTIKYTSVGSSTLTVTANTGTPVSTSVNVDVTDGATDVPMLVFNAKSTVGASTITDVQLDLTGNDAASLNKVTSVKLYDGLTLLGSVSLDGVATDNPRTATFTDLAIPVAKDATKTLLVRVDIGAGVTSQDTIFVALDPANVTYEKPDLSTGTALGTTVTGKTMDVFDGEAAIVSFVSGTSTYTYNSTTPASSYSTGVITIKMKADGGLMTKPVSTDFDVEVYDATDMLIGAADSVNVTVTPNTDVSDGTEATVVINASETQASSGTGFIYFKLDGVTWTVGATGPITQDWGLDDFRTPSINVQ